MFKKIAERITNTLIQESIIPTADKEIYEFGIRQLFTILLNFLTILIIGLIMGMFWESALFLAAYMFLRRFAGGFHSQTSFWCYMYSNIMVTAVLLAVRYLPYQNFIFSCLLMVGSTFIFWLAPVEDQNKPLDNKEQCIYRKRTRIILSAELCTFILLRFLQFSRFSAIVSSALFCLGIIVLIGKLKNMSLKKVNCKINVFKYL